MTAAMLEFVNYAWQRHNRDGHLSHFDCCPRRLCRRARQLEVYLILTGQWAEAAYGWLVEGGQG